MQQLNYLKKPTIGDRGTLFCPAIEDNFESLDEHNHNGENSEKIDTFNLLKGEVLLSSAAWVASGSEYKQTVTLPAGYDFDKVSLRFIINSGPYAGHDFHPTVVKLTGSTFDIYCTESNLSVRVVAV